MLAPHRWATDPL